MVISATLLLRLKTASFSSMEVRRLITSAAVNKSISSIGFDQLQPNVFFDV